MLHKSNDMRSTKLFLIDNFDSFTYNLVNQLRPLVDELQVFRNDVDFEKLCQTISQDPSQKVIVISPGPGNPDTAGHSLKLIEHFKTSIPILGICLGHQAIVQNFAGKIGAAQSIIHGKADVLELAADETEIFGQLQSPFVAARYHSLAATLVPPELKIIASVGEEVMAVKHRQHKILGFQFHPESILTPKGGELMQNSLNWLLDKVSEQSIVK